MPKTRPPYPAEFKQQIVELARAGRTPAELEREFGCSANSVTNWVNAAQGKPAASSPSNDKGLSEAERAELQRLRRENRQLKTERDILAKATAWFANNSDKTFDPSSSS
jgi:transposase